LPVDCLSETLTDLSEVRVQMRKDEGEGLAKYSWYPCPTRQPRFRIPEPRAVQPEDTDPDNHLYMSSETPGTPHARLMYCHIPELRGVRTPLPLVERTAQQ